MTEFFVGICYCAAVHQDLMVISARGLHPHKQWEAAGAGVRQDSSEDSTYYARRKIYIFVFYFNSYSLYIILLFNSVSSLFCSLFFLFLFDFPG